MKKIISSLIDKAGFLFLVLLAGFLNIYNLWSLGYGNSYYAAAIKSMTTSFVNFFFLSFDSTGFISVDKAPLSLWLDTLFAKIFGFSGMIILLPHALAGILVTILVYKITQKVSGKIPAFFASLAVTLSPVNVAVYRNNTPDSLLLVFILLTIWFVVKYFDQKKFKYLILSALMLGLGFNVKMLQAFLILPALAAAIFIFSEGKWFYRLKNTFLFLLIVALVSSSWITIVDLVPSSLRPYVGGSENNSAWNLALGYNGSQRLLGENGVGGTPGFNVGQKGLTRLFTGEMGTQTGWLLTPVILFSLFFLFKNTVKIVKKFFGKNIEFSAHEKLTFINIIFFLAQFLFFSYASFFHSYYLNIFAIPIAFLVGSIFYTGNSLLMLTALPVQIYLISQSGYATWLIPALLILGTLAFILIVFPVNKITTVFGKTALIISLFLAPLIWSGYTTLYGNTASAIFIGGPGVGSGGAGLGGGNMFGGENTDTQMLSYLKENYAGEKYFLVVSSQQQATNYILNENITNVMALGGFSGRDQAISLADFQNKVNQGEIRFVLINGQNDTRDGGGMFNANEEITSLVSSNCKKVGNYNNLYDCKI